MPGQILESEDTQDPSLVAAVDLGSNSFHLLVGRVEQTPVGPQIFPIDSLKDPVRLASGLSPDKRLDAASQARALSCLARFGERLRALHPDHVRAVATNTFRVAKNGPDFLQTCEAALGFPIEVIAGKEEARLPECTEEERWIRTTQYAVKREGRKTAIRVLDDLKEAEALAEKEKGFVEIRKGEAIRCTNNFCGVNQWCKQYQASLKGEDE